MKVEEREGNVLNLVGRFADLINRIKYHIDVLEPWKTDEYYTKDHSGSKIHEWVSLMTKIEKEYTHIVDLKKELFTTYDKLIDSSLYRSYKNKFSSVATDQVSDSDDDDDDEILKKRSTDKPKPKPCFKSEAELEPEPETEAEPEPELEPEPDTEGEPEPETEGEPEPETEGEPEPEPEVQP